MDVHLVFNSFNKMLSISYEIVYPAQALFLEHISSTYPYLLRELATLDLGLYFYCEKSTQKPLLQNSMGNKI